MVSADRPISSPKGWRRIVSSPLLYAIAGLWLLLLGMEKIWPCFFLHDDNAVYFIEAYVHDWRVLSETGRLAEVNYYQHSGEAFLEQGQTAVLYPFTYLGVALAKWVSGDVRWTIEWMAAEHLTLGLLGFYFWARINGVTRGLAALGGLAWVLNPFVIIVSASWIMVTYVAAWMPWLFGAFDRLWMRPSLRSALLLGTVAGLFFLQGYVQWTVYASFLLGIYALMVLALQKKARSLVLLYYVGISVLMFLILILPLLLPMWHATMASTDRGQALDMGTILFFAIPAINIYYAQILYFLGCAFGASTGILFSPGLILVPVILLRLIWDRPENRRRIFAMLVLAVLAMMFSTSWYQALTYLPVFDRFRWPFKMFLLAHFFLLGALVASFSGWASAGRWWRARLIAAPMLALAIFAELAVGLSCHDYNIFSEWTLPRATNPLVPGMDPLRGRVAAFGNEIFPSYQCRYLTHLYGTYYAFPSLGGYNPLVSWDEISHALSLDYPNFCTDKITPDAQKNFEDRAVRYWIVDPLSTQYMDLKNQPGFKVLERSPDRVIFEDILASPVAFAAAAPGIPCDLRYVGNSIFIQLGGVTSPVEVSVGPSDAWWYRIDHGPWLKPVYENERLKIDFDGPANLMEVSFFDPRFWDGVRISLFLLLLLGVLVQVFHTSASGTLVKKARLGSARLKSGPKNRG